MLWSCFYKQMTEQNKRMERGKSLSLSMKCPWTAREWQIHTTLDFLLSKSGHVRSHSALAQLIRHPLSQKALTITVNRLGHLIVKEFKEKASFENATYSAFAYSPSSCHDKAVLDSWRVRESHVTRGPEEIPHPLPQTPAKEDPSHWLFSGIPEFLSELKSYHPPKLMVPTPQTEMEFRKKAPSKEGWNFFFLPSELYLCASMHNFSTSTYHSTLEICSICFQISHWYALSIHYKDYFF